MSTIVRTHEPPLAQPREFLRSVWHDVRRSRPLAVEMARRDVRGQYRQSLLGPATVVLPPLAMTLVALGFRRAGILTVDSAAIPYALFVLVGATLWTTFLDAVNAPMYGLLAEQRLLARTSATAESVVLGKLGPVLFNVVIKAALLAIALAWYGFGLPVTAILAPLGVLSLATLGTAVGLILAPINLVYRDISRILATATTFWFFFSPVYFPAPSGGAIGAIMRVNPVTPLLSGTRSLLLSGIPVDLLHAIAVSLAAAVLLVLAWLYVRVVLPVALEQVSE